MFKKISNEIYRLAQWSCVGMFNSPNINWTKPAVYKIHLNLGTWIPTLFGEIAYIGVSRVEIYERFNIIPCVTVLQW